MPKSFLVELRTGSIDGPVRATSNIITIDGTTGNITSTDFADRTLSGIVTSNENSIGRFAKTMTVTAPPAPVTPGSANYTLSAIVTSTGSTSTVTEGDTVTFNLTVANIAVGSQIPFTVTGVSADDVIGPDLNNLRGYFTVQSDLTASYSIYVVDDYVTEPIAETLTLTIDGTSVSSSVNIVDSSQTMSGTAWIAGPESSGTLSGTPVIPRAAAWVMFRMIGAGGAGGGGDEVSQPGGVGGGGAAIRGIVRLPRTANTKVLVGGVGAGAVGVPSWVPISQFGAAAGGRGHSFGQNSFDGAGGAGGAVGPSGRSGPGGGGGGSTSLGFYLTNVLPQTVVGIAAAAGGGGGGGASLFRAGGNATVATNTASVDSMPDPRGRAGNSVSGDGGGGGGGGGGFGIGGNGGLDRMSPSTGGSIGNLVKNTTFALDNTDWHYYEATVPTSSFVLGVPDNVASNNRGYFGYGGIGAVGKAGPSGSGTQGALSVYWTTASEPPSNWNLVPGFREPADAVSISNRTMWAYTNLSISFYRSGQLAVPGATPWNAGYELATDEYGNEYWAGVPTYWTVTPTQFIGNLYQIRATLVSSSPNSGVVTGNSLLGTWHNMDASTPRTWTLTVPPAEFVTHTANILIEIRGVNTQTIFDSATYSLRTEFLYQAPDFGGGQE